MDVSGIDQTPIEGVEGLIAESNNPLEVNPNNSQQLNSLNITAQYNLDIDGNLAIEAQDYNVINLYSAGLDEAEFEVLLDRFANDLLGEAATRTEADDILGYLNDARDSLLDIDNNGIVEQQDNNLINLYAAGLDEAEFEVLLERFPEDLLGDGGTRTDAASILARFEIISNFDVTPPLISASLVEDTGSSDNDFLTNNPTISGTVEDISLITEFKAGFDDALEADFVDVLGQLQEDGSFNFDAAIIQEINNNTELSQGEHTLKLTATDVVGNKAETFEFTFILDSENPDLIINTPVDDGFINGRSNLTGNLEGTGSGLASLSYRFDQGELIEVTVDENGNFDQRFDVTGLSFDEHSLTLIATDEAGNITEETVNVTVQELTSLRVTGTTPLDGATEIGSTFRPQVFFSEPIDTSTLNENNFYASFAGQKLAANIVPGEDGTFAWLFFEETMPNASLIQVTVDGSTITNLEGSSLDADGDGIAGGIQTFSFTTVSLEPIPNTTITGFVLDPGPDKLPFTEDDFDAGADGIEGTEDDIFLLPIAGAEVFILGLEEEEKVITDEQGRFTLTEVPVGNVKVEVQGMTATNAPEGFYFPEMVMDVNIEPGVENFIMGMEHIYLPRIDNEILNTVTASETTMIMAGEAGAPELSEEERNSLTLEIQPQSLVGEDGEKLDNAEIGISTVPPELVRDMLPPGVLQHTFDITIQAPGVTRFSEPAPITFPNVFDAAPGTKLNFLSFNHETGRLEIEGTATVSEDGLSVTSDPGTGITQPGWHGVTPPGGCGGSGGAPPMPPEPSEDEDVTEHDPEALDFIKGEMATNWMSLVPEEARMWTARDENPDTPSLPPIPGCNVPRHNPNDDNQQPFINVTIEIDGPLKDFMKPVAGGLPLESQGFTLSPGTGDMKTFGFETKSYDEVFGAGGFTNLMRDQLYGAQIKITVVEQEEDGTRTRDIYTYYQNRWVDVIDAEQAMNKTGNTAAFHRTLTDGFERTKNVDYDLPAKVPTSFDGPLLGSPFDLGGPLTGKGTAVWKFDPFLSGDRDDTFDIEVDDPNTFFNIEVGEIEAIGTATNSTSINVNLAGYQTELKRVINALEGVLTTGMDGNPGVSGVDDDMNGTVDDITEYGWAGSDDTMEIIYDYANSVVMTTLPGPDMMLGTGDDK